MERKTYNEIFKKTHESSRERKTRGDGSGDFLPQDIWRSIGEEGLNVSLILFRKKSSYFNKSILTV